MLELPAKAQAREVVHDGDLIADNRLAPGAQDLLEHDAIARGVAEIAWTADAPVNIALFGAWGSGKSSVYSMIEEHLNRIAPRKVKIARYDAWKYGGRELKRNFIDSLAQELKLDNKPQFSTAGLETEQVDTKLHTFAWLRANFGSLLLGVLLAAAVAALWVLMQAGAAWAFTDNGFKSTAEDLVSQAGTVFGLALIATLVGPKVFEGAVITTKTPAPEGSDQFAKRFSQLVQQALSGRAERLVVFIDELDRCDPKDVVATLIDLKTFLDQENCVFIVAADRDVIERALNDLPQAKPVREDEPYYATPGAFLDKIFQHQLALPPLRSRALTKFAHDLVDKQGGIWKELRDHGADTFDRAVFALVPVHVRSPRRVKVLLNNFATNARIAGARDIGWLERAHEVAVLTVLQTEFPAVAEDLRRVPRLLVYLRGEETAASDDVGDIVASYIVSAPVPPTTDVEAEDNTESAAGRLLSDDTTPSGVREREMASTTLRRHLGDYLAKVAAAGIRDPRPDLLYLQAAGGRENLPDPRLGDTIDFATDTAPDAVVAAFAAQTSATLAVAIPLLVTEGDNATGPGKEFAYESACRLVERLDADDHATVTALVAPSLMAASKNQNLSQGALPGALLVACWDGSADVVRDVLERLNTTETPEPLLDTITVALPYLGENERELLVAMLADRFDRHPQPLLSALRDSPIESAIDLWVAVEDQVLAVLNALELPEPEPAPAPPATTRTAAQATAAAPAPEPTGLGIARLEDIIETVRGRADHEPLLSSIVQTVQHQSAVQPIRAWVNENADQLVATMGSPLLHAWHALLGLEDYPAVDVETWSALLPDHDALARAAIAPEASTRPLDEDLTTAVTETAGQLLTTLLGAFATVADPSSLQALIAKVAPWAKTPQDETASTVATTLQNIGWEGGETEDEAGTLLWTRKEALFDSVVPSAEGDDSPIYQSFVSDLAGLYTSIDLPPFAVDHWCRLGVRLPERSAQELSARLDTYEPRDRELGAVLRMKLAIRAVFGGDAPLADAITALPPDDRTTAITDAWLQLSPDPDQVKGVLAALPFTTGALRSYCDPLDLHQRTAIWLSLFDNGASDGHLRAAGAGGVSSAAVTHVGKSALTETRANDRSARIDRLRLATPADDDSAAVKKAASELASDMLDKGTSGDLRTAAEVVLWAGGAAYGHTQTLRQKFNDQVASHEKALPKRTATELVSAGLLVIPKKGFLSKLLGQ